MRLCYCGSNEKKTLYKTSIVLPEGCNLEPSIHVVECLSCGFVFSDTNLTQKDYDSYYGTQDAYAEPNKDFSRQVVDTHEFCKEYIEDSVLDIGCGGGHLLRYLKTQGVNVKGVDTSKVCVDKLVKDGIPCTQGSIFSALEKSRFVTFVHVLEHILDMNTCVKRLCEITDKYLYIEVPDSKRYPTYPPFQDFNTEHINHFTLGTLVRLFERNGMRCVKTCSEKTIHTLYGDYGILRCVFTKENQNIEKYIEDSENVLQRVLDSVPKKEPVCIHGAGQFTYKLLAKIPNVTHIVDDMKCRMGTRIHGITVTNTFPSNIHVLQTFSNSNNKSHT